MSDKQFFPFDQFKVFGIGDDLGGVQTGVAVWCSECRVYSAEFHTGTPLDELMEWSWDHVEWCGKDRV